MRSLLAKLLLAWTFILQILKKPFSRGMSGDERFLGYYLGDRLIPLNSTDRKWLARFSMCFNCGLCDTACPATEDLSRETFPGPGYLVTTFSRATTDFWAVDLDFSLCRACDRCQQVCPNQVPVKEALEFIEAKKRDFVANHRVSSYVSSNQSLF